MRMTIAGCVWCAGFGILMSLIAAGAPRAADAEAEFVLPVSPTGFPMEALWNSAPGVTDDNLLEAGPFRVSLWGNIVVRGRREDGHIVSALSFIQCDDTQNPAMTVTLLGEAPDDLCDSVTALTPGSAKIVEGANYTLYGQSTGWTVIDFAQATGNADFNDGWPPPSDATNRNWGESSLGAVFRYMDGQIVFFAPGETVKLTDKVSFVVKTGMDEGEFDAILGAAILSNFDTGSADGADDSVKRPIGFYIVFIGIPILLADSLYRLPFF